MLVGQGISMNSYLNCTVCTQKYLGLEAHHKLLSDCSEKNLETKQIRQNVSNWESELRIYERVF